MLKRHALVAVLFAPASLLLAQATPAATSPATTAVAGQQQPPPPPPPSAGDPKRGGMEGPGPMARNGRDFGGPEGPRGPEDFGEGRDRGGFGHFHDQDFASKDRGGEFRGGREFGGDMHQDWWRNPEVAGRVGLTPDQTHRLDTLALQTELTSIQLRARVQEEEVRLHAMLESPTLDEHAADAQIDKLAEARAAMEKAEGAGMISMRAVLTPAQWTKLRTPPPMHGERGPEGDRAGMPGPAQRGPHQSGPEHGFGDGPDNGPGAKPQVE